MFGIEKARGFRGLLHFRARVTSFNLSLAERTAHRAG
jgi:hypothetical protein